METFSLTNLDDAHRVIEGNLVFVKDGKLDWLLVADDLSRLLCSKRVGEFLVPNRLNGLRDGICVSHLAAIDKDPNERIGMFLASQETTIFGDQVFGLDNVELNGQASERNKIWIEWHGDCYVLLRPILEL